MCELRTDRQSSFCARAKFHLVKKPLREPTLVYRLRTPYLEKQSFVKGGEYKVLYQLLYESAEYQRLEIRNASIVHPSGALASLYDQTKALQKKIDL